VHQRRWTRTGDASSQGASGQTRMRTNSR
jgi:hypothetical protein